MEAFEPLGVELGPVIQRVLCVAVTAADVTAFS
jgi:hypothetical protein